MKFSIVIPAYNEAEGITKSVQAVGAQNISRHEFEIIVVDNNSHDNTSEMARLAGADKVVLETTKGTNFARQRGYKESSGQIIAFLDADSLPPIDWLQRIEHDLEKPGIAAVSGPYHLGLHGLVGVINTFINHRVLSAIPKILVFLFHRPAGMMIGGNFAVHRATLEKIGGLPPLAFWGDDAATAMLISRHVGKVFFDPLLTIYSSPRRYKEKGAIFLQLRYFWVYLKMYFSPNYR